MCGREEWDTRWSLLADKMTAERRREMMMSRESHTMAPPTHLISMIQVKERTQAPGTSWWRTEREREREREPHLTGRDR